MLFLLFYCFYLVTSAVEFLDVYYAIEIKKKNNLINKSFENPEYELNVYTFWNIFVFVIGLIIKCFKHYRSTGSLQAALHIACTTNGQYPCNIDIDHFKN